MHGMRKQNIIQLRCTGFLQVDRKQEQQKVKQRKLGAETTVGVRWKCRERQLTEQVALFGQRRSPGKYRWQFPPQPAANCPQPCEGRNMRKHRALRLRTAVSSQFSLLSHFHMLLTRQATKKKKRVLRVGWEAERVSDAAGRLLASEKAKVIKKEKNERRIGGFVEPEREEAPGRSSPAAGGSEDGKYHKSCSGAAADALWISRTPGNPNDGSLCTRRAAAEISISVWFAQIRTRGG